MRTCIPAPREEFEYSVLVRTCIPAPREEFEYSVLVRTCIPAPREEFEYSVLVRTCIPAPREEFEYSVLVRTCIPAPREEFEYSVHREKNLIYCHCAIDKHMFQFHSYLNVSMETTTWIVFNTFQKTLKFRHTYACFNRFSVYFDKLPHDLGDQLLFSFDLGFQMNKKKHFKNLSSN